MARVLLVHSTLGLRPAVLAQAERWRAAGHEVVTPDLFEGVVLDDVDAGMAHQDAVGFEELLRRLFAAAEAGGAGQVMAGWSMGGWLVQHVLQQRGDAAAALLMGHAPSGSAWPGIPAQAHVAEGDPWVEDDELAAATALGVEVHRYSGGHLFGDPDLPDFDAASAALLEDRALAFLERVG